MKIFSNNTFPNLKSSYIICIESALILSISAFIVIFKLPFEIESADVDWTVSNKEVLHFDSILPIIELQKQIPDPPHVMIPLSKVKDEIIEEQLPDIVDEFLPSDFIKTPPEQILFHTESRFSLDKPILIGGLAKLQKNIEYPMAALKDHIQGPVIVRFIIDKKGFVRNPEILKGIRKDINSEALRAISESRYKPARRNGEPIIAEHVILITFRIETRTRSLSTN